MVTVKTVPKPQVARAVLVQPPAAVVRPKVQYVEMPMVGSIASKARAKVAKRVTPLIKGSAEVQRIAKSLLLPEDNPAIRYPSRVSNASTAVSRTTFVTSLDFSVPFSSAPANPGVAEGSCMIATFRNPLRACVYYYKNPLGKHHGVRAYFSSPGNLNSSTPSLTDTFLGNSRTYQVPFSYLLSRTDSGWIQPHGAYLYPGRCLGRKGFWIDGDTTITTTVFFTVTGGANFATCSCVTYQLAGGTWQQFSSTAADNTTGVMAVVINQRGYYAFEMLETANVTRILSMESDGSCDVFAHRSVFQLEQFANVVGEMRVAAHATLLNNTADQLHRGGDICGYQAGSGQSWQEYTSFDLVASNSDAFRCGFDTGIYSIDKLCDEDELQLTRPIITSTAGAIDYSYDLLQTNPFNVHFVRVAKVDTTWPGGIGLLHVTHSIEYKTPAQWVGTAVPDVTPEQYAMALEIKKAAPTFYENPLHLAAIGRLLWAGAKAIAPHIGTLFGIGKAVHSSIKAASQSPNSGQS